MDEKTKNEALFSARNITFVLVIVALVVSGYLSYLKIDTSAHAVCVPGEIFDCGTVLNSVYSEIMGIPIAWLGFTVNVIVLTLLILEPRLSFAGEYGIPITFGVLLFATLFSIYLIYVQAVLITKYCPYCLSHEALVFLMFGFSIKRLMTWMDSGELETE